MPGLSHSRIEGCCGWVCVAKGKAVPFAFTEETGFQGAEDVGVFLNMKMTPKSGSL